MEEKKAKGITYASVADAATSLKARGIEPTGYAIRAELGNTGSFTTIQAHLAKWKAESNEIKKLPDLPPEVEAAMHTAIATCWAMANKVADEAIAIVRQEKHEKEKLLEQAEQLIQELEKKAEDAYTAEELAAKKLRDALASEKLWREAAAEDRARYAELNERYKELLKVMQPKANKIVELDTTRARPSKSKGELENKQASEQKTM